MAGFWIAEIRISAAVEWKLRTRRGLTGDEVRLACIPNAYERAYWHDHPEHGWRVIVRCRTVDGTPILVFLQPVDVDAGIWRLRTVLRRM